MTVCTSNQVLLTISIMSGRMKIRSVYIGMMLVIIRSVLVGLLREMRNLSFSKR